MKKTVLLISNLICSITIFCQVDYDLSRNYYDIVNDAEIYFEDQRRLYGTAILEHEGSEYSQYKKWTEFWEPRLAPHGDFESYFKAYETVVRGRTKSRNTKSNTDYWDEIGPTQRPTGGLNSIGNGGSQPGIGPIEFLEFYLQDPDKMICGSLNGGLFYTTNGGATWQNSGSDDWFYSGCRSATIDPSNFNNWFAVSHLSVGESWAGFAGGIWMTNNAGTSWSQIATATDLGLGYWTGINKVLLSPSSTSKLMFGASNGFKYTNNVYASPITWYTPAALAGKNVYDFEIKINNSNYIYASAELGGVWEIKHSTDGGVSWSNIPGAPSTTGAVYVSMEVTRANNDVVYFIIDKNEGSCVTTYWGSCTPISEIWKYNISSGIWTLVSSSEIITHGQSLGFGVSNSNENDLYISYIDRYRTKVGGVWNTYDHTHANRYDYHVDIEDFVSHPFTNGEIWMADHGGLHKSTDFGVNWTDMSNGLGVANVTGMDISQNTPDYVSLGLYHDGTVLTATPYSAGWNPNWNVLYSGDGMHPRIDYEDPTHQWFASQSSGSYRYSDDYGVTNQNANPGNIVSWNNWAELNSEDPTIVFSNRLVNSSPQRVEVVRSANRGLFGTYTDVSDFNGVNGLSGDYLLRKIATAPENPDYLYAFVIDYSTGPTTYRLYKTTIANDPTPSNIINSWAEVTMPNPDKWIQDIVVDYEDPDIIYISYSSTVSGTWTLPQGTDMVFKINTSLPSSDPNYSTNLTFNLPNVGAGPMELEKGTNSGLYLATDVGVYFINGERISNGSNWMLFGQVPHVPGSELKINYEINKIRYGTHGRGVWEHDLYCPDILSVTEIGTYSADEYIEVQNNITSYAVVPNGLKVRYRAGNEIRLKPNSMRANYGSDFHAFIHKCNAPGNSFKEVVIIEDNEVEELEEDLMNKENGFSIFPNPNKGEFSIHIEDIENINSIQIMDLTGRIVTSIGNITDNLIKLNISEQQDGIYLVKIVANEKVTVEKIIKQ